MWESDDMGTELHDEASTEAPADPRQELAHLRVRTRRIIASFAAASAVAAAAPLPIKDAIMLSPLELVEVNALASVYGIPQEESVRKIFDGVVELGIVSVVARRAIGVLEARPRLPLVPRVKSALIAAVIVTLVGSLAAYTFEQVYLGKLSIDELGVVRKLRESSLWQDIEGAVTSTLPVELLA